MDSANNLDINVNGAIYGEGGVKDSDGGDALYVNNTYTQSNVKLNIASDGKIWSGGGGGSGSMKNIAMYDPQAGGDVKGLGITGKHRSKHQINSLMANAISLEAHRAAEAELTRLGGGGGSQA